MDPRGIPPEVWEAICRQCGRCCTEKVVVDGRVTLTKTPCRFLDATTRTCVAYPDRFRAEPGCTSVPEGLFTMIFPEDCPYIRGEKTYTPPVG